MTPMQTSTQLSRLTANFCSPLGDGLRATVKRQTRIISAVIFLFFHTSPIAVVRRISTIVIAALQCQTRRSRSHISIKSHKIGTPFWAHCDSSTAPVFIPFQFRVMASLIHMSPCAVFNRLVHPMTPLYESCQFSPQTTTAGGCPSLQSILVDSVMSSAIAKAQPCSLVVRNLWSFLKNHKTTESVTHERCFCY